MAKEKLVEIARSFSYKKNVGNYETRDFFCSQKAEVTESEAEKVSKELYEFCRDEVMKSVKSYLEAKEKAKKEAQKANELSLPKHQKLCTHDWVKMSMITDSGEKLEGDEYCGKCSIRRKDWNDYQERASELGDLIENQGYKHGADNLPTKQK